MRNGHSPLPVEHGSPTSYTYFHHFRTCNPPPANLAFVHSDKH